MRIQRLRLSALPPLPSESRNWWRLADHQIIESSHYLTHTEAILCGLLGVATGFMFRSQDCTTAVFTSLIGLTLPATLWLFDMFAKRQVLATKTFFTDFPVHGIASLDDDLFAISGGGGGLAYGIPDQCAIVALQQQGQPGAFRPLGALAFHVINNSDADASGREELQKLDLAVLQSLTPHSFWGLAASSGLLCGGVAGIFHVFRVASAKEARSRAAYVLLGDALGRCLIPIGSHTLIEQPFSSKKKLFIHHSIVQGNKIGVLTEDNRLAYYIVLNDFLCLVAIASFHTTRVLAVHFDTSGDSLLVLTADHRLLQYAAPNVPPEVVYLTEGGRQSKSMGCQGLTALNFVQDDTAHRRILRNSAALTWTPMSQIKFKDTLTIDPRHLIIVPCPPSPEGRQAVSQQQDTIILVGTVKANTNGHNQIKTPHASIAYSRLIRKHGDLCMHMMEPWTYKVLKNIGGCPAVAVSDQYLTVVGNKKFVVLDKHTLAIKQAYDRHDHDSPADNTLPVTAADISKNEKYLLVGTADYSVVVAPLDCPPARWWDDAVTSSSKIRDYFKAIVKVSSLTVVLAFLMTHTECVLADAWLTRAQWRRVLNKRRNFQDPLIYHQLRTRVCRRDRYLFCVEDFSFWVAVVFGILGQTSDPEVHRYYL